MKHLAALVALLIATAATAQPGQDFWEKERRRVESRVTQEWQDCLLSYAERFARQTAESAADVVKAAVGSCQDERFRYSFTVPDQTKGDAHVEAETQRMQDWIAERAFARVLAIRAKGAETR